MAKQTKSNIQEQENTNIQEQENTNIQEQENKNIQEETKSTFQEDLEPEPESVETNFHYIIQSPEVLARHLCLMLGCEDQLKETIEWLNSPIQFVEIEDLK